MNMLMDLYNRCNISFNSKMSNLFLSNDKMSRMFLWTHYLLLMYNLHFFQFDFKSRIQISHYHFIIRIVRRLTIIVNVCLVDKDSAIILMMV